ncbi:MAG: NUDIX domain-containing protein, partial [Lachnospiraceae bacterium]|nr:NUDIX domain-containing protein [Lachnospiraceae bacterium]
AEIICRDYGGHLPKETALLKKLPGIGPYSAGAIASIAYGMNEPAVDGNVLRVLSRVLGSYDDIMAQETRKRFEETLREVYPHFPGEAGNITQSLMELGALVCVPNGAPACEKGENCPLEKYCRAYREGLISELPVKAAKAEKKEEKMTVFLLTDEAGEHVILARRPEQGLLAGMYEYPHAEGHLKKKEAALAAEGLLPGLKLKSLEEAGEANHIFTHIVWKMKVYRGVYHQSDLGVSGAEETSRIVSAGLQNMKSEYPMPNAFSKLQKMIGAEGEANTRKKKKNDL